MVKAVVKTIKIVEECRMCGKGGCPEIQSCFGNPGVRGKGLNKSDDGENGSYPGGL